jgi:hypothetical protein
MFTQKNESFNIIPGKIIMSLDKCRVTTFLDFDCVIIQLEEMLHYY